MVQSVLCKFANVDFFFKYSFVGFFVRKRNTVCVFNLASLFSFCAKKVKLDDDCFK